MEKGDSNDFFAYKMFILIIKSTSMSINLCKRAEPSEKKGLSKYFLNISDRRYGFDVSYRMQTTCILVHLL